MDKPADYTQKPEGYFATSRTELMEMVPAAAKVILDIGCAEGLFGGALLSAGAVSEVWGVEPMTAPASIASTRLSKVLNLPIEPALEAIPDGYFDCVAFNDVLEHLNDPWGILRAVKRKLKPGGYLLTSIPNIRHVEVFLDYVVNADFEYQEEGVLDRTHVRFFTKSSMRRMLEECGYSVETVKGLRWSRFPTMLSILNILMKRRFEDVHYMQFAMLSRLLK